jgi:4-alpha-glucanotransferase
VKPCRDDILDIQAEARAAGVLTDYYDARGQHLHVPVETLRRILDALPMSHSGPAAEPIVHRAGSAPLEVAAVEHDARWSLRDGEHLAGDGHVADGMIQLPNLEAGVYRLEIYGADGALRRGQVIVVAPLMAFQGEFDRVWVLAVQLYSLRSARNWGIGDFTDLKHLLEAAATLGCAGIGLNPLHALFDDEPDSCSPYAPSSRLFLNPIYIDVEAIPEFGGIDAATRQAIVREKRNELIDYKAVAGWKRTVLELAFAGFKADRASARWREFEAFRELRGPLLARFAHFEAMRKQFRRPWWEWPEECRKPIDVHMDDHRMRDGRDEIDLVEYVQWIAHAQLQTCADLATRKGMKVGLYLDVAVGVRADGFDAWLEQDAISRELSVGAPPDMLNTAGQDWGLAGFNSAGLVARDFQPFRAMIEASARYSGAIRLDHVLGLGRLYLVPSGASPREGAYVTMPLDPLLAVAALESQAQRCIIIGEDLGTVPDGFREKLRAWGIWSYQVMLFERDHDRFNSPDRYTANALVTFNTHDLSSFEGWRSGHDLRVKHGLAIDPGEREDERFAAIAALHRTLADNGIHAGDFAAVIAFLGRTPSRILSVAIDDILGVVDQVNVPGTVDQHPNWRRRLPVTIDAFCARYDAAEMRGALAERSAPST